MEYVIIGGDERFAHLARLLRRQGRDAGTLFREAVPEVPSLEADALRHAENAVMNYPLRLRADGMSYEMIRGLMPAEAKLFLCGPKHPEVLLDGTVDLWADETLQLDNARLTAEGAVSAAMRAGSCAISDMRCMVVGWGRIGRALTEILVPLGAQVTAASRTEANRNRAVERGAEAAPTQCIGRALPGHRLIFNTAPGMVLDAETLDQVDHDAMIIDLASPPYGVDLHAAWNRGLRAWREPALPGRYCPESAARVLLEAIYRRENDG